MHREKGKGALLFITKIKDVQTYIHIPALLLSGLTQRAHPTQLFMTYLSLNKYSRPDLTPMDPYMEENLGVRSSLCQSVTSMAHSLTWCSDPDAPSLWLQGNGVLQPAGQSKPKGIGMSFFSSPPPSYHHHSTPLAHDPMNHQYKN